MQPAKRTQIDGLEAEYSIVTGLEFDEADPRSRSVTDQSAGPDTDINKTLAKFGVGVPLRANGQSAIIDFDLNLQDAYAALNDVQTAHASLPLELRNKYPTWQHMIASAQRGDLRQELDRIKTSENLQEREAAIASALAIDEARDKAARAKRAERAAARAELDEESQK